MVGEKEGSYSYTRFASVMNAKNRKTTSFFLIRILMKPMLPKSYITKYANDEIWLEKKRFVLIHSLRKCYECYESEKTPSFF